jgi:type II secretion system (T2SS) protein N
MWTKSAVLLAVAIFLLTLLVRLPAALLPSLLPKNVLCLSPSGTLWQGECGALRSGEIELANVRWSLHPLELLRARVTLDVQSDDARTAGSAQLTLRSGGEIDVRDLRGTVPMPGPLSPLPSGWSGELELAIDQASIRNGHPTTIVGVITARQLHSERPPTDLGSYELRFAGTPMLGTLRDLEGPLSLQGQVQLSANGSYELNGSLAAHDDANPDLQQMLRLFGAPDAQGRRQFSLAGTL